MSQTIAVIGARGHTGAELLALLAAHPSFELVAAGSRALAGQLAIGDLHYQAIDPSAAAKLGVDAVVLALPNGAAAPYVDALSDEVIVDLSADHRFDDDWTYGLPERRRDDIAGARRIANPGCYATAAQLALDPIDGELAAPPRIFGISGYSGAGTTPSPRNDKGALRDNVMPYSLCDHVHEREISRQLGTPVHFMPHVAPFFRGITLTIDCALEWPREPEPTLRHYEKRYAGDRLVVVQREAPLVRDAVGAHHATIGGFACHQTRMVIVATIDNLLKGAATQAVQNLNLALGQDEHCGIPA